MQPLSSVTTLITTQLDAVCFRIGSIVISSLFYTAQGVTEIYYCWQVTKELVITPDLQVIIGDGLNGADNMHVVAGLLCGLTF